MISLSPARPIVSRSSLICSANHSSVAPLHCTAYAHMLRNNDSTISMTVMLTAALVLFSWSVSVAFAPSVKKQ